MKTTMHLALLLILCCSAPVDKPLYAQNWAKAIQQAEGAFARANIKNATGLKHALVKSAARAQVMNQTFKRSLQREGTLQTLYPIQKPTQTNSNVVAAGWALTDNKLLLSARIIRAKTLRSLQRQAPFWTQHLQHHPSYQAAELATHIPTEAKYIFLGEYHDFPDLTQTLQQTVLEYQRLHPEKQVLVFSEFLYDTYPSFAKPATLKSVHLFNFYAGFFDRAGLSVAGLEEDAPVELSARLQQPPEETLLGVRTRNNHWTKRLQQWRDKYPEAVFFIHAGNAHTGYNEPFAVSLQFPAQETFVAHFVPAQFNTKDLWEDEMFHALTKGKFFKPGTLWWTDSRAARLAGFDAQVIFPVLNPNP